VKHLADVIQLAQRAQQSAMTPEQIAEEQRRDEQRGRAVTLSLSAPPIRPEDKHAIVFDTLAETPWLEAVREWHAGSKSVLVLSGSVGSGKTVAACWAMAGDNGLFVSAANLARIVGDFDRTEWRRFASCRLLVVDDLGDELQAERLSAALKQIISERGAHGGRTVLTTNETPKQLKARYPDEKLWSRIAQSCDVVVRSGGDMRRGA
jgi:DNA replication protein DnaC